MANIDDLYPSKYLKASDLQGNEHEVTIDGVITEPMNDGAVKAVVYFVGKKKGLVLNVTNKESIKLAYGIDFENDWPGKELVLFEAMASMNGRPVPAIRVRAKKAVIRKAKPIETTKDEAPEDSPVGF